MSLLNPALGRVVLNPHINSNFGCLNTVQQLRFRKRRDRMEKPDDKSKVFLGKVSRTTYMEVMGVSERQYPIMMKWNKPQRVETCNSVNSGDLKGFDDFGPFDLTKPPLEIEDSKELDKVEEEVKRILSLEFRRRKDLVKKVERDVVSSVQSHKLDMNSPEVYIAHRTVHIRNMQHALINNFPYKNQPVKHSLTKKVAQRRVALEKLREQDYKKYEWILEKLQLFYKPLPKYDHLEISRRVCIERLTDMWCDELKKHRLDKYKRGLQEQQPGFLRNKAAKLKHIMEEEKDLGLPATVQQAEIDECLSRADEIEERLRTTELDPDEFKLFKGETVETKNFIGS